MSCLVCPRRQLIEWSTAHLLPTISLQSRSSRVIGILLQNGKGAHVHRLCRGQQRHCMASMRTVCASKGSTLASSHHQDTEQRKTANAPAAIDACLVV